MKTSTFNHVCLLLLFVVTAVTVFFESTFWMRFFWSLAFVLFYAIYKQYNHKRSWTTEAMFLFFFLGNVFTLFYERWFFSELSIVCLSAGYLSLLLYLYNRRGAQDIDNSFKPFFIGAFVINVVLVTAMLTAFSRYFENALLLPVFILYFIVLLALVGFAFLHFNSVATLKSLYLLGFILSIVLADVFRFLDYYYYTSTSLQFAALCLFSGGYFFAYMRLKHANDKEVSPSEFYKEVDLYDK